MLAPGVFRVYNPKRCILRWFTRFFFYRNYTFFHSSHTLIFFPLTANHPPPYSSLFSFWIIYIPDFLAIQNYSPSLSPFHYHLLPLRNSPRWRIQRTRLPRRRWSCTPGPYTSPTEMIIRRGATQLALYILRNLTAKMQGIQNIFVYKSSNWMNRRFRHICLLTLCDNSSITSPRGWRTGGRRRSWSCCQRTRSRWCWTAGGSVRP